MDPVDGPPCQKVGSTSYPRLGASSRSASRWRLAFDAACSRTAPSITCTCRTRRAVGGDLAGPRMPVRFASVSTTSAVRPRSPGWGWAECSVWAHHCRPAHHALRRWTTWCARWCPHLRHRQQGRHPQGVENDDRRGNRVALAGGGGQNDVIGEHSAPVLIALEGNAKNVERPTITAA